MVDDGGGTHSRVIVTTFVTVGVVMGTLVSASIFVFWIACVIYAVSIGVATRREITASRIRLCSSQRRHGDHLWHAVRKPFSRRALVRCWTCPIRVNIPHGESAIDWVNDRHEERLVKMFEELTDDVIVPPTAEEMDHARETLKQVLRDTR